MIDFMDFLTENTDKKNQLMIATSMMQYPTGFMYLDYGVGSYATVYDSDDDPICTYHNIGITEGSVNVVISKSQGGKTSLLINLAAAIIEPYVRSVYYQRFIDKIKQDYPKMKVPESDGLPFIQIMDTEKTLTLDYVKKLTHYANKDLKRLVMINQITTDKDLIVAIEKHIKFKVSHMAPTLCPMLDIYGNPMTKYPPTVVIIDSM